MALHDWEIVGAVVVRCCVTSLSPVSWCGRADGYQGMKPALLSHSLAEALGVSRALLGANLGVSQAVAMLLPAWCQQPLLRRTQGGLI